MAEVMTDFLFARPSFIEGLARLVDFSNSLQVYNASGTEIDADAIALAFDWRIVGQDLVGAIARFADEASLHE